MHANSARRFMSQCSMHVKRQLISHSLICTAIWRGWSPSKSLYADHNEWYTTYFIHGYFHYETKYSIYIPTHTGWSHKFGWHEMPDCAMCSSTWPYDVWYGPRIIASFPVNITGWFGVIRCSTHWLDPLQSQIITASINLIKHISLTIQDILFLWTCTTSYVNRFIRVRPNIDHLIHKP